MTIESDERPRLSMEELSAIASQTPPEDLVRRLADLHPEDAAEVMALLSAQTLRSFRPEQGLLHVVEELADDDAADVVAQLSGDTAQYLLNELTEGQTVGRLMKYDPETAGGLMTTDVVTVRAGTGAAQAIEQVRRHAAEDDTAPIHHLYVVDAERRLRGVLPLRKLVLVSPDRPVDALAEEPAAAVQPELDQEEVARTMARVNLTAVPVVDAGGVLLGEVTFDDVTDVVEAEQTEDILKFGGMETLDLPYKRTSIAQMLRKRAGWLLILFVSEMFTATAMGHFETEIQRAVVLALFIPLIISSGGNSGSQATSLIIRAMALGELALRDWWRVAMRELPSGLALGGILGMVGFLRITLWQAFGWYDYGIHHLLVATTVGTALIGVVTFGCLAGSMLPFVLRRFGFDPASASAPFVATLVDVTGIVIYFSVAALMLSGTLL
jgi:magnesium transporter